MIAVAVQLAESLMLGSVWEVAVTVIVVEVALLGTVAVSVAVPEAPEARVSELGETCGDQPVPPETSSVKLSVMVPSLVTTTVYLSVLPACRSEYSARSRP